MSVNQTNYVKPRQTDACRCVASISRTKSGSRLCRLSGQMPASVATAFRARHGPCEADMRSSQMNPRCRIAVPGVPIPRGTHAPDEHLLDCSTYSRRIPSRPGSALAWVYSRQRAPPLPVGRSAAQNPMDRRSGRAPDEARLEAQPAMRMLQLSATRKGTSCLRCCVPIMSWRGGPTPARRNARYIPDKACAPSRFR